jgi:hypothetical protein
MTTPRARSDCCRAHAARLGHRISEHFLNPSISQRDLAIWAHRLAVSAGFLNLYSNLHVFRLSLRILRAVRGNDRRRRWWRRHRYHDTLCVMRRKEVLVAGGAGGNHGSCLVDHSWVQQTLLQGHVHKPPPTPAYSCKRCRAVSPPMFSHLPGVNICTEGCAKSHRQGAEGHGGHTGRPCQQPTARFAALCRRRALWLKMRPPKRSRCGTLLRCALLADPLRVVVSARRRRLRSRLHDPPRLILAAPIS